MQTQQLSLILVCIGILSLIQIALLLLGRKKETPSWEPILNSIRSNVDQIDASVRNELQKYRVEFSSNAKLNRDEISGSFRQINDTALSNGKLLREEVNFSINELSKYSHDMLKSLGDMQRQQLETLRQELQVSSGDLRSETRATIKALEVAMSKALTDIFEANGNQARAISESQNSLSEKNQKKLDEIRAAVESKLKNLQEDNNKQLDQMRVTVDEKLHGTLETRLGEKFKLVSERLEAVHKGLGEMQVLATGVGDLKRVLTNVKTRGTWGEVQLGAMLEQVLIPDQYESNASPKENSERVEFVIKMPGKGNDIESVVWLPIDSKFPLASYERLMDAKEKTDLQAIKEATKSLESDIVKAATDISAKYINPPKTTDFAILFTPTEGLFSEVIRNTGLVDKLQRELRIVIAGPTTLWSILTSLQVGFKTLAIEKRSSDVWKLLSAVKAEWKTYGLALDKVKKNLQTATNNVEAVATRSRNIGKKLQGLEELSWEDAQEALALNESSLAGPEEDDSDES